ncbi:MAG: FG-GAP-like repeat-containing protein [Candidatus Marinimicrobia bacterium]|jgi:hypothetical protein|nr:FG-GAP-like repeat-containing protein [Candidatus Neomarinimicrobiota bacterium]
MITKIFKYIRLGLFIGLMTGVVLLAVEVYFVVTNSNRPDFWPDDGDAPYQDMSSGLFSAYIHDDNPDYEKMKAKGSVLCDFDLDGDLDLYFGYVNSYYFENSGSAFKDRTMEYNIDNSGCRGIVVGDIDNNGYPDILKWRFMSEAQPDHDCPEYDYEAVCVEDPNCIWEENNCWNNSEPQFLPHLILMNDGNSSFSAHNFLPSNELPFLHSLGLLDADLDGDLDLLAIQEEDDDQFMLYLNEGFDDTGAPYFAQNYTFYRSYGDISSSRIIAISDYDGDGDQDVYVGRKYGYNWFFENQTLTGEAGDVTYHSNPEPFFIEKAVPLGIADSEINEIGSMGYGAAWGDYDNDQDFDLYLANWGVNRLYNNDNSTFTNVADVQNVESEELSNGVSWGDYNNDGMLDLWTSNIRNPDDVYINLGDGIWDTTSSPYFLSGTQDLISGDINEDGWLDVFAAGLKMQNGPQGAKYTSLLYKNVTVDSSFSSNHWLKLKLEGSQYTLLNGGWSVMSNRSAIGARVVLHLADQDIMREIIGGKGHGNMEPLQLHFGMNSNMSAQGMTIYWPSRDPETNQRKITYVDGPIDADLSYTFVEDIGFVGLKGDINRDNIINVQDVVISVNHALDGTVPEPAIFWAADMNYDNILNILDVVRILNVILG